MLLSSKKDDSSLCYDIIIIHKILKIDYFDDFRAISIITGGQTYLVIFPCLRFAAGGHKVSAGGALWVPGVTWINCKGDNIPKYVCPTVIFDIARKITKFVNFKILKRNDDVITE